MLDILEFIYGAFCTVGIIVLLLNLIIGILGMIFGDSRNYNEYKHMTEFRTMWK